MQEHPLFPKWDVEKDHKQENAYICGMTKIGLTKSGFVL